MKVLVVVKRVVDFNVKLDDSGIDLSNFKPAQRPDPLVAR